MAHCGNCFCKECNADRERDIDMNRDSLHDAADIVVYDHFHKKYPKAGEGVVRIRSIVIKYEFLYEKNGKTKKHHTIKAVDTGGPMEWND